MKYLIVLGDGMADRPLTELKGMTPLEYAATPNFDKLAAKSSVGLVKTVPDGMKPGSDVANLSVLGYDPKRYYSGRSPLEALSIGVIMKPGDVAVRTNLVTLSDEEKLEDKTMLDYSAGEIPTEEARKIIESVEEELGSEKLKFYSGVSYRHCLIETNGTTATRLTPPHDISGKKVGEYLPQGEMGGEMRELIRRSGEILASHPVNVKRRAEGKRPATHVWFWGAGTKPTLDTFFSKFGLKGAIVSAVDLLKGIAKGTEMYAPCVKGATGTLSTNWKGKVEAVKDCFKSGIDYVYLHFEAPDECGHQGDIPGKIAAIEKVDEALGELKEFLDSTGEDYKIAVLPDHPTPIEVRTHTSSPVPYMIYDSRKPVDSGLKYNEKDAQNGEYLDNGQMIIAKMTEDKNA